MKSKWFGEIEQPESELNRAVRRYLEFELDALERSAGVMAGIIAMSEKPNAGRGGDTIKIRRPVHLN